MLKWILTFFEGKRVTYCVAFTIFSIICELNVDQFSSLYFKIKIKLINKVI